MNQIVRNSLCSSEAVFFFEEYLNLTGFHIRVTNQFNNKKQQSNDLLLTVVVT